LIDLIVNPASGSGAGGKTADEVMRGMDASGVKYAVRTTEKAGDAAAIAQNLAAGGSDAIVCVGGDGSVQEIVGAIAGSGIPLGIIPAGSGNDLVASLYEFKRGGAPYYLEKVLRGETRAIDLIKCTAGSGGPRYFANIGSVGLDAEIVHKADDFKKVFGRFAYIVSTVYNAFTFKPGRISVDSDAYKFDGGLSLVAVCNGGVYGGGFRIAPRAEVNDGLITLCVVKPLSKPRILMLFPSVLSGKHVDFNEVDFYNVKKVAVNYDGEKKLNLDGNIFFTGGPLSFEIMPGALRIFA